MKTNGDPKKQTLELEYPAKWVYKVIGASLEQLESAALQSVGEREHSMRPSRRSSAGRYVSLTLEVVVEDDASRVAIFQALRSHHGVTIVL
jgi:putative lipoic acid-binding regulatory protein